MRERLATRPRALCVDEERFVSVGASTLQSVLLTMLHLGEWCSSQISLTSSQLTAPSAVGPSTLRSQHWLCELHCCSGS
jgi:hypothetical protein